MDRYIGKDGTQLFLVSDKEFNTRVANYLRELPKEQWPHYLQPDAQKTYKLTGIGYFPNGMATEDNKIYIRYKYRGDAELIAHEYGHILGHDHTPNYSIMNAVSQKRVFDPLNLEEKAKANFPELWRNHIIPRETYHNIVVGGLAAMTAWALMV